ncbi:MAG: tRNA (adenosine(37)-N6)-threonylcarbamoyltransferase complex ATPase subunit type 1 TsaE [Anaerolineales bacterium]|nr:tRNA (adenosine(37)-N6)-threonylcarbamoyltransferase complex ATPase subunit type 1 TsaE [Anaerolineales bacterium]MCB8953902.1 tRNA (adenosine(37)-N6)-threonylcarbamoyltransferase complex ATPase subunit type 1 TsaE [Ardenticatenales bacterium]
MAILDDKTLDFISSSEAQTERLGVRLGELLQPMDVICLSGELGAGKTVLARGIGRGWGAGQRVTSPTFTLVNQYPRLRDGLMLYHVDCYRLETLADAITVGLEDMFASRAVLMIEWPERIEALLPADRLTIALRHINETRRGVRISASEDRSLELLKLFRQSAFGV